MSAQLKPVENNSNDNTGGQPVDVGGVAGKRLKAMIERIEVLIEQRKILNEEMKEIFAEAKGTGFDPKTMRTVIRLRAMDKQVRMEQEEMLDLYKTALGMLD